MDEDAIDLTEGASVLLWRAMNILDAQLLNRRSMADILNVVAEHVRSRGYPDDDEVKAIFDLLLN
ncbi:hypothetical protein [Microvirga yunnanensis]|uniref:hypothetical protein n=1 Tax=Microvirga yunnanensis TaxID=2953740 RepID=UPI0021C90DF8|nr:hypothetical protein [Microvirga sp. HBU65207]